MPRVEEKIAFDKFHIAKYLGEAVDKVGCQEHKALMAEGYEDPKGSQYDWLYNPENVTRRLKLRFKALRDSTLKTARALGGLKSLSCHSGTMPARHGERKARSGGCHGQCAVAWSQS
ncbi:MAG: transposase, partial [Sedimenticolaceae bacterium]